MSKRRPSWGCVWGVRSTYELGIRVSDNSGYAAWYLGRCLVLGPQGVETERGASSGPS